MTILELLMGAFFGVLLGELLWSIWEDRHRGGRA